jgi:hypothetical protein
VKISKSQTVQIGQSIVFGSGDDAERGVVIGIDGDLVTVAWEQGCETTQTASYLGLEIAMPSPDARTTAFTTADGLRVYDLCPQSPDMVAVAGPDGIDPRGIDADYLPEGFRWVTDDEWAELADTEGK